MNIHVHSGPTPRGRGVSEALMAGSVRIEHRSAIASNRSFPIPNSGQEILGVAVLIQPDFASKMQRTQTCLTTRPQRVSLLHQQSSKLKFLSYLFSLFVNLHFALLNQKASDFLELSAMNLTTL